MQTKTASLYDLKFGDTVVVHDTIADEWIVQTVKYRDSMNVESSHYFEGRYSFCCETGKQNAGNLGRSILTIHFPYSVLPQAV